MLVGAVLPDLLPFLFVCWWASGVLVAFVASLLPPLAFLSAGETHWVFGTITFFLGTLCACVKPLLMC